MRNKITLFAAIMLIVPIVAHSFILAGVFGAGAFAPNAPTSPSASVASTTSATVSWTNSTVDGTHSAASSYNIKWGNTSGTRSTTITGVTTPATHSSLTSGLLYYYSIVALNASGSAESSETVAVIPSNAYDLFTGTNSTTAQSHTGSYNTTWTKLSTYSGGADAVINGNQLQAINASYNAVYYNSGYTPGSANYTVQATFTSQQAITTSDLPSITVRQSSSLDTHYRFQFFNGNYSLNRRHGGTEEAVVLTADTWPSNTTRTLKMTISGYVITCYVDGVSKISFTDSDTNKIAGPGYAGFALYGTGSGTSTLMDNWSQY